MKKKNRILIAGLMAIAITGASTFAYFTSTATIAEDAENNPLKLDITNGKVSITAQIGDGSTSCHWYYDPVDTSAKGNSPDLIGLGKSAILNKITDTENSIYRTGDTPNRWKTGTPVVSAIKQARPGDGFTLGQKLDSTTGDALGAANDGLVIKNDSDLTIKFSITKNTNADTEIAKLIGAGWVLKIGDQTIINSADVDTALVNLSSSITTALNSGTETKLEVKVYLPTNIGNTMQTKQTGTTDNGFNLNSLFVIKATQENNPGYSKDGSSDNVDQANA